MAAPLNDESKRLLRYLEDGEWHPLDAMRARLAMSVAPGKALRKYEEKAAHYHANYGARVGPELSDTEKISSGQKALAGSAVRSMKRNFVEIRDVAGQGPVIRLRPGVDLSSILPPRLGKDQDGTPAADDPADAVGEEGQQEPEGPAVAPANSLEAIRAPQEDHHRGSPVEDEPAEAPAADVAGVPMAVCQLGCGLYVANQEQHGEFHRLHPGVPPGEAVNGPQRPSERVPEACAFFSEQQVRAMVQEEVEHALDAFQKGMQTWLVHRFAALETLVQGIPRSSGNPELDRKRRVERPMW